jgi:hypothetical protein
LSPSWSFLVFFDGRSLAAARVLFIGVKMSSTTITLKDCDRDLVTGVATSALGNDWGTEDEDTDFFELLGGVFSAIRFTFEAEHITRLSHIDDN